MNSYDKHHYPPKARGGHHFVRIPTDFHESWHVLFEDLYGWEVELCVMDFQQLCRQSEKKRVAKEKINQARVEIRKLSERPDFLKGKSLLDRFYRRPFSVKPDRLPEIFREAWKTIFKDLGGYRCLLFIRILQTKFTYDWGKIRKSKIGKLREELNLRFELACWG